MKGQTDMENDAGQAPAFPVTAGNQVYSSGLTLRDWLAAQALPAIIAADGIQYAESQCDVHAQIAYAQADAMLRARSS